MSEIELELIKIVETFTDISSQSENEKIELNKLSESEKAEIYDFYLHADIPTNNKAPVKLGNKQMMEYWNAYRILPNNNFDLTEDVPDIEFVPYSNVLTNKLMMGYWNAYRLKPNNDFYVQN